MADIKGFNSGAQETVTSSIRFPYSPRENTVDLTAEPLPIKTSRGRGLSLERIKRLYSPPHTLGMPEDVKIAQDSALDAGGYYNLLYHTFQTVKQTIYPQFMGYGVLSGLMQNQVIRSGIEMIADEMTREWITLNRVGEEDFNKKKEEEQDPEAELLKDIDEVDRESTEDKLLQDIEQEFKRFDIQRLFREAFALTGYMGGCLIYIDTLGDDATPEELLSPLYLDEAVFPRGALKGFRIVEPFNVSPGQYQANNPLRSDYFKPKTWWVQGREIHASRVLYFAHNLPSTLLLPAYNFFGMPIAQLVLDAVTHFTSTRESTMRALKKYSLTVFKTPLNEMIGQPNFLSEIQNRVQFMCDYRDNDGIEIIDNESEAIETVVSPIAGMTEIVRQAMDIVAAMFNEPTVKLWGITPSGLNSTGEADLTNHYDNIASMQEAVFKNPLRQVLRVLQWNKFQNIDDSIDFTFKPLGVMNEQTLSQIQSTQAQRDMTYINAGVLSNEEVRARLAADPESGYSNIDVSDVPEPQGQQGGGEEQGGGMPDLSAMMGGTGE